MGFVFGMLGCFAGCAVSPTKECYVAGDLPAHCVPEGAIEDAATKRLYDERRWRKQSELPFDPVALGSSAQIPIHHSQVKVFGPSRDNSLNSLAARLWLIDNAEHTIDLSYYIFKRDPVGYAVLGALCNAVKRGVDVRIMVDSVGSIHPTHTELKALETCGRDAGFMKTANGEITTRRASVQAVIFNAITKFHYNRRSHDKIIVVDGHFPEKAAVITGGRNISLDYYGIYADGSPDYTAFRDAEMLLRPVAGDDQEHTVGDVSEYYFSLLFLYEGNKRLRVSERAHGQNSPAKNVENTYRLERDEAQKHLEFIRNSPEIASRYQAMGSYMSEGFHIAEVRLAHQMNNMTAKNVTTDVRANLDANPNSINYLLDKIADEHISAGELTGTLRIVSPYLFCARFYNKEGELIYDGARELHSVLEKNPNLRIEIVTNSVLTSDNIFAQAIIDMDMAPRLLLDSEAEASWLTGLDDGELESELVKSQEWLDMVNHPQIFIYQTGKSDASLMGGDVIYGKLHAKYIVGENAGFLGTSNFDYRSELYNNEMGFFFKSEDMAQDLIDIFEELKQTSHRWGTPEWLEMRKKLMESGGMKGNSAKGQRATFKTIRALNLEYLM